MLRHGGFDCISEFYQYMRCDRPDAEHRTAAAICKLRTDIIDQSLHWDWHGSEYRTAGTKILKWRRYKGGLIYEYRTYCT